MLTEEKRVKNRYAIVLDLEYKVLDRRRVQLEGVGRTVNISSTGVLFETDQPVPCGRPVELKIKWPFLLQGFCGMNLVVHGQIIRGQANNNVFAVRMESHEFRTAGYRMPRQEIRPMQQAVGQTAAHAAHY